MSDELNEIQFQILDAVYFVEPLANILEETDAPATVVLSELRGLIHRGWVQVMQFDPDRADFVRTAIWDTDNMHAYRYLATKEGLLRHNGH
ncbi:MAG: hypothetical protein SF053_04470 [Bacteroidia bacterium]|jgi:hypothetical protein|nr:hypothetical protein [Bacteroidia bacterium]